MKRFLFSTFAASLFFFSPLILHSKTLVLEGKLKSSIEVSQEMEFRADKGKVNSFSFKFALPADFESRSVSQSIESFSASFKPEPSISTIERDRFGNRFQNVVWDNVTGDITVKLAYIANINSRLSLMESTASFPLGTLQESAAIYLKPTVMVQSENPEIIELARFLTADSKNEYEAVTSIVNHVTDLVKYTFNPPQYDALYTLRTKSGNCQNFAHLSIALLRSAGIPARIVGGITMKESWKVPVENNSFIVQSIGQGGHAWIEVYFPDIGWLPYDPQQSRQFTSSRHIKQTHGMDSRDINDSWRGAPYLPVYSESVDGVMKKDEISLKVKKSGKDPRPYVISNLFSAKARVASVAPPSAISPPLAEPAPEKRIKTMESDRLEKEKRDAERAARLKQEEERKAADIAEKRRLAKEKEEAERKRIEALKREEERRKLEKAERERAEREKREAEKIKRAKLPPGSPVLFGNMEFPNLVQNYSVSGNTGTRILDKETSEYVTSGHIYAQSVFVRDRLELFLVSLAMRKFGGDGNIYVDVVKDLNGRPNILDGIRSDILSLEDISRKPGYYWVDFTFPDSAEKKLEPGKYWIVLRYSGDAIMNWFYIPGKPYSNSDDTRSTAKGLPVGRHT